MVSIQEHKGKHGNSYYVYDYVKENNRYRKIYIKRATYSEYQKYRSDRQMKQSEKIYCNSCGKRNRDTLPSYLNSTEFDLCRC